MTTKQILIDSIQKLQKAKIPSADLDAEILLAHSLNKPKEFLYAYPEYAVPKYVQTRHGVSVQRRLNHEPIAYIINKKEFYGLDFYVDGRVLIPRPESEVLVEKALKVLVETPFMASSGDAINRVSIIVIDIGIGSGCVIVSLVKNLISRQRTCAIHKALTTGQVEFFATDISSDALEVAKINAKKHKVDQFIKFYQGDLLEPVWPDLVSLSNQVKILTIIIANLPYITPNTYQTLSPEIKKHEPKLALLTPDENPNYYYQKLDKQIDLLQKKTKAKIWRFYEKPN